MTDTQPFYTLHSPDSTVVIDCRANAPAVLYWGARLGDATTPEMLATLATRQKLQAHVEREAPISLSPERGAGFAGSAGIDVHRGGRQWGVYAQIESVDDAHDGALEFTSRCSGTEIRIVHRLRLDPASGVLVASTEIENTGSAPLWVDSCSAPTIPVPRRYSKILGFEGRWSNEFQTRSIDRFAGCYLRENRAGRTSHDTCPAVFLHEAHTSEQQGAAIGLHLGWSGNHRLRVEELSDGRVYAQLGELFFPGEVSLEPGQRYRSPELFAAQTDSGLTDLSQRFHRYVRANLTAKRMRGKTKPVHFNTWEATYFDLSLDALRELAAAAADVGVERFVLDDGWFRNRRSDRAGLGDWFVDETVFPDGLGPLIEHVNAKGMEFGLWVEPEMVNPDSDLYRAHPDWVLSAAPVPPVIARNQLVLDLTRPEVQAYLFERIDALLSEYPIAYLKWDMNRDLSQPGGADGVAAAHDHTLAVYALMRRIREAHPAVEIESCSSGGARADFGILAHTDRVWTSDNNDPLDRARIQRGFSLLLPPEFMGSHVSPATCHISGRRFSMATRAGVALFGDFGIEANLLDMSANDLAELKAAVALHKQHRKLLFGGHTVRLDLEDAGIGHGVVAADGREALFSYLLADTPPRSAPGVYRFRGLVPNALYQLQIAWPVNPQNYSTSILDVIEETPQSGAALMTAGMQLPVLPPASVLVMHLRQVS